MNRFTLFGFVALALGVLITVGVFLYMQLYLYPSIDKDREVEPTVQSDD